MTDLMFQKNLQDLIKSIRANKRDPAGLIASSIADAKSELRSTDGFIKAEAVRKLTYLQMIGYDISWASFGIVEVMSMPRFGHKRIGFLAGNQSFTEKTDVLMLTTNLLKRLFGSADGNGAGSSQARAYEVGLGVSSLANIVNPDLSRDCMSDIVALMKHSNNYVRKKAVLVMYKMYLKYPQGLRLTFDSLKEHLDDADVSVTSTAVNVVCELANKNPRNYLAMAPKFFQLLTTSTNNWLLIKIVKLFGSLVSEEPRLARKLLEPLVKIIQSTGAKSLQYECIFTITQALLYHRKTDGSESKHAPLAVRVCSEHLRGFVEDSDPNLRYMGLVGLAELLPSAPRSVVEHRELVLKCLSDDDVTIKTRALELLSGIASKKSLVELVNHLMTHVRKSDGKFRDELIGKILDMCSKDRYALVSDFRWLVKVLVTLVSLHGGCLSAQHGEEVTACLMDVALRVEAVRTLVTQSMLRVMVMARGEFLRTPAKASTAATLRAAGWIVGEYCDTLIDAPQRDADAESTHVLLVDTLLHPTVIQCYPASVQKGYVHCAVKVFASACVNCEKADLAVLVALLRRRLGLFMAKGASAEVCERASSFLFLLAELRIVNLDLAGSDIGGYGQVSTADVASGSGVVVTAEDESGAAAALQKSHLLSSLVGEKFYAVHPKAQRKVPLPTTSLTTPLDSGALSVLAQSSAALFAGGGGSAATMQSLTLVAPTSFISGPPPGTGGYESGGYGLADEAQAVDRHSHARAGRGRGRGLTSEEKRVSDVLFRGEGSGSKDRRRERDTSNDSSVFMLGSGRPSVSNRGASTSPADGSDAARTAPDIFTYDEIEETTTVKVSRKGRSKRSQKDTVMTVNSTELMPAGASVDDLGSSDEERIRRRAGGKTRSGQRDTSNPLATVDITTPLDYSEVLPVLQHRVSTTSAPTPSSDQSEIVVDGGEGGGTWKPAVELGPADAPEAEKKHRRKHGHKHKHGERDRQSSRTNGEESQHRRRKHRSKREDEGGVKEGNLLGDL